MLPSASCLWLNWFRCQPANGFLDRDPNRLVDLGGRQPSAVVLDHRDQQVVDDSLHAGRVNLGFGHLFGALPQPGMTEPGLDRREEDGGMMGFVVWGWGVQWCTFVLLS